MLRICQVAAVPTTPIVAITTTSAGQYQTTPLPAGSWIRPLGVLEAGDHPRNHPSL
jgi:hypothetical protein